MQLWKYLAQDFKAALKENPWLGRSFVAIFAGLIVLITLSQVARVNNNKAASTARTSIVTTTESSETIEEASNLSDEQKSYYETYDSDEKELLETLCSGDWYTSSGDRLEFSETNFKLNDAENQPFVVTSVDAEAPTTTTFSDNVEVSATEQKVTFAIMLKDGSIKLCHYTETVTDNTTTRTLNSEVFGASAFTEIASSTRLLLSASSNLDNLIGSTNTQKLTNQLIDWCSTNAPAASKATWDEYAEVDYKGGVTIFKLLLNDPQSITVVVTYSHSSAEFSFVREQ